LPEELSAHWRESTPREKEKLLVARIWWAASCPLLQTKTLRATVFQKLVWLKSFFVHKAQSEHGIYKASQEKAFSQRVRLLIKSYNNIKEEIKPMSCQISVIMTVIRHDT